MLRLTLLQAFCLFPFLIPLAIGAGFVLAELQFFIEQRVLKQSDEDPPCWLFRGPIQRGQGLVEYAFIILLVALAVIVMMTIFGATVGNMFSTIVGSF